MTNILYFLVGIVVFGAVSITAIALFLVLLPFFFGSTIRRTVVFVFPQNETDNTESPKKGIQRDIPIGCFPVVIWVSLSTLLLLFSYKLERRAKSLTDYSQFNIFDNFQPREWYKTSMILTFLLFPGIILSISSILLFIAAFFAASGRFILDHTIMALWNWVVNIWHSAIKTIQAIWEWAVETMQATWESIIETTQAIWEWTVDLITRISNR